MPESFDGPPDRLTEFADATATQALRGKMALALRRMAEAGHSREHIVGEMVRQFACERPDAEAMVDEYLRFAGRDRTVWWYRGLFAAGLVMLLAAGVCLCWPADWSWPQRMQFAVLLIPGAVAAGIGGYQGRLAARRRRQ